MTGSDHRPVTLELVVEDFFGLQYTDVEALENPEIQGIGILTFEKIEITLELKKLTELGVIDFTPKMN